MADATTPPHVALVLMIAPNRYPAALKALEAFEKTRFPPNTPANDLYHVGMINWNNLTLAVTVFPETNLLEFAESLRECKLALVRGVPTMFGSGGEPEAFPVDSIVRKSFGISLEGRAYTFEPLTRSGRVLREGVELPESDSLATQLASN